MNDMRQITRLGRDIEAESFATVDREAGEHGFAPDAWQIVRRVIHATADFEFAQLMEVHSEAVASGVAALRAGCPLIVDVRMIEVGLNAARLDAYGVHTHCFISDHDVIADAKRQESTRAIEAMKKAQRLGLLDGAIVAVGNAPTALLALCSMIRDGRARPALVIGVPVGFVSAAESKDVLREAPVPAIIARGRKGGSPIAVAIVHALLLLSAEAP
jgi:precorrin-8X/cobalt-precorrin-8 methylmutase